MPVITPAYPSMCSTHNITRSTQRLILQELHRAESITRQIYEGKQQWSDLFQRNTFFTKDFKYYLCVVSASKTKEAQAVWSGLIESKVRRLVAGIEDSQEGISMARPFVKPFHRVHRADNEEEVSQILQGKLTYLVTDSKATNGDTVDEAIHATVAQGGSENIKISNGNGESEEKGGTEAGVKLASTIYTTTYYIGIDLTEGEHAMDLLLVALTMFHPRIEIARRVVRGWRLHSTMQHVASVRCGNELCQSRTHTEVSDTEGIHNQSVTNQFIATSCQTMFSSRGKYGHLDRSRRAKQYSRRSRR